MNVNNKLYRLNFNQNLPQQQPRKEEEKAEQKESPSVKAPDAKPVTMNLSDVLAEMNKAFISGVGAPLVKGGDENLGQLIESYWDEKANYFKKRLEPNEALDCVRSLLDKVNEIITLLGKDDHDWIGEKKLWEDAIEQLEGRINHGGRGITDGANINGAKSGEDVSGNGDVLLQEYLDLQQKLDELSPGSPEYIETVETLYNLAKQYAKENLTSADANWDAFVEYWHELLVGGRGINVNKGPDNKSFSDTLVIDEPSVLDRSGEMAGNIGIEDLLEAHNKIWDKVQDLLDEFNMNYDVSIFENIHDGEEHVEENRPYQEILYELGQRISEDDLLELRRLVMQFERMLSDFHNEINPDYLLDKIKHSVFHGIAPFILAPRGLY